jgi:hypothetical protein
LGGYAHPDPCKDQPFYADGGTIDKVFGYLPAQDRPTLFYWYEAGCICPCDDNRIYTYGGQAFKELPEGFENIPFYYGVGKFPTEVDIEDLDLKLYPPGFFKEGEDYKTNTCEDGSEAYTGCFLAQGSTPAEITADQTVNPALNITLPTIFYMTSANAVRFESSLLLTGADCGFSNDGVVYECDNSNLIFRDGEFIDVCKEIDAL